MAADRDRSAGPPPRPVGRDGPEEVEGPEELVVYFSYDPNSWKSLPFLTAVRWNRIFTQPE